MQRRVQSAVTSVKKTFAATETSQLVSSDGRVFITNTVRFTYSILIRHFYRAKNYNV